MKRKRLAELVREEALQEAPAAQGPDPERPLPPYLTYVRKECRLRPDQLDALTALARKLNRERKGKGERITENTLIRWAVDAFLRAASSPEWEALSAWLKEEGNERERASKL